MKRSEGFQETELLPELKRACGASARLPGGVGFTMKASICSIHMPREAVCGNLQTDYSAFEGWALVMKARLGRDVSLSWQRPGDRSDEHYQRFLYRIIRFAESVDWFNIGLDSLEYVEDSDVLDADGRVKEKNGPFLVNLPGRRKAIQVPPEKILLSRMSENELEKLISTEPRLLLEAIGFEENDYVMRQIPVGLFTHSVSSTTRVFPGVGGKVDLGAIDDASGVALFELKKPGNTKVGAISEILFYSHVVRDLQLGAFRFEDKRKHLKERQIAFGARVSSFILSDRLNPTIDEEAIFTLLNSAFSKRKEHFGYIAYRDSGDGLYFERVY